MKSIETYKLGVVLEVNGQKAFAALDTADRLLGKVRASADNVTKGLASTFGDGLKSVGSNLANIKAGIDIVRDFGGFVFGLAKGAADAGSEFHDLNVQTGLNVETLSGLRLQLKESGTDMAALARGTLQVQKNLGEAASGSKELRSAFASLGIRDVRAALGDTDGTMRTLVKSLASVEDAGVRNALGTKLMGRGYKELAVFIAEAGGNLDEIIEQARKSGQVMSDEAADAADAFGDQLDALADSASVAGRTVGIEALPQITGAMRDLTGATAENTSMLRSWGREMASTIELARVLARTLPKIGMWDSARDIGAKFEETYREISREKDIAAGKLFDLNAPATPEQIARGARERARAMAGIGIRPAGGGGAATAEGGDFFAPGEKGRKARKEELDRLVAFAKEWDFVISSVRGGRHNPGSLHPKGRAVDVDVRGKSDKEVRAFMAAAREAGFGVRDERVRPPGQKVWSGPHIHLTTLGKAAQAANKELDAQEGILGSLARKLAEAEMSVRALGQSSIEQELASTRMSLGLQKLEGPAADLAESMMADYEAQLKARESGQKHAEALDALKGIITSTTAEVFGAVSAQDQMTAVLKRAEVPLDSYRGKWAMLLATMKDVGDLTQGIQLPSPDLLRDIPVGDGPVVQQGPFDEPPPEMKPDRVRQVWKELTSLGDETRRLQFTFQQLAQSLQQQQQVGQKRGFFSKLLGFAAPFLNFIPGVGPILSLGASVASRALAGDYLGAALGAAGGFAPGGAFRGSGPAAAGPSVDPKQFTAEYGAPPPIAGKRALGGPVRRGRAYLVGELRPEVFTPDEDGWIHPSAESFMGGGRRGRGVTGGALARVLDRIEEHFARLEGVSPDHFFALGAKRNPGAVTDAFMRHGSRDPQVINWMQRRTQPQAG